MPDADEADARPIASGADRAAGGVPVPPLARNVLHAVAGNGTLNLCRLGVYALLAKFASADVVGVYDFASLALAGPVVLFLGLEARAAYVADAGGEFSFGAYRALRRIGMLAAAVVLAIATPLLVAYAPSVAAAAKQPALIWLIFGACAGRIALHLGEIEWGVYQRFERLDLLSKSNMLRGLLMIAPFAVLMPFASMSQDSAERAAIAAAIATGAYALGWLVMWRWFDVRNVRRLLPSETTWSWSDIGKVVGHTLPLGLVMLLITLCDAVPRWVILNNPDGGTTNAGHFGALMVIALGATFLMIQVGTAAGNRLAVRYQTDRTAFLRLTAKLTGAAVLLGAAVVAAAWLIGRPLLQALYAKEYADHSREFMILMAGQAVLVVGTIFGVITTHMRQFWIQVPVQFGVLATTTVAALLLIPAEPVSGAAWTSVVRALTQTVLYLACVLIGLRREPAAETPMT